MPQSHSQQRSSGIRLVRILGMISGVLLLLTAIAIAYPALVAADGVSIGGVGFGAAFAVWGTVIGMLSWRLSNVRSGATYILVAACASLAVFQLLGGSLLNIIQACANGAIAVLAMVHTQFPDDAGPPN